MSDKIDGLIKKSFEMNFEPGMDINKKILEEVEHRKKSRMLLSLSRVAVIIIAIIFMGSVGVYASNHIFKKGFVTEHSVSVGNPDYVDDAAIVSSEESVVTESVGHEEGNKNVRWISKDVQTVNGYATNTYYAYKDYETAVLDSGLDNWFNKSYENAEDVIYVVTETEDTVIHCINANFLYGEGNFYIDEEIMSGNIAEDAAHSVCLQNTNNERTYTSASGQAFTLVDEITANDNQKKTIIFVMVAYDDYFGYISFENLKDKEIHKILDTVKLQDKSMD